MLNIYIHLTANSMILQNSPTSCCKKTIQQKISLFNILTCMLCTLKARMAHICPNCSKFFCEECIKSWMDSGNQHCPHCKNYITSTTVVNCNKLSQDLSNALQTLIQFQTPQQSLCQSHNISQTYYCQNCIHAICSDCIVLETSHRGHNVVKLKKVKIEFNQLILSILSKIRKTGKDIEKLKEQMIQLKNNQPQQTKAKIEKLNNHIQRMRSNYEGIINQVSLKFQNLVQGNKLLHISAEKIYEHYAQDIKQMSKINLIKKSHLELQNILINSMKQVGQGYLQKQKVRQLLRYDDISNTLTSKFSQKTFMLYNYTQFKDKKEVIYSDAFFDGSLEWRLKIYPSGLQKRKESPTRLSKYAVSSVRNYAQEYISIYIELVAGIRQIGRYKFNIEIINQSDSSKVISQVYEADFESGKCWGYDQFANISTLYQKGYIHPQQDSLKISVSVGPPSYFHSTLDQKAIINKKQQILCKNAAKLQELRNNFLIMKSKKNGRSTTQKQKQKQNPQTQPASQALAQIVNQVRFIQQIQDVKTPRSRNLNNSEAQKNFKNYPSQESFDFEKYYIELPKEQILRKNEQFDYQSAQLRKIYRRISHMNEKSNLLMF